MESKKRRIVVWGIAGSCLLLGIVALLLISTRGWYTRERYTCLQCRLDRVVERYWVIPIVSYRENVCSQWYARTNPGLQHQWRQSMCTYHRHLLGGPEEVWCSFGHPVFAISPEDQKVFLEAASQHEIDEFFRFLDSEDLNDHTAAIEMARAVSKEPGH